MGFSVVNDEQVLQSALALCRGVYQREILLGRQALSGSTLRGKARNYKYRYQQSAQSILARCRAAGLPVRETAGRNGKRLVLIG